MIKIKFIWDDNKDQLQRNVDIYDFNKKIKTFGRKIIDRWLEWSTFLSEKQWKWKYEKKKQQHQSESVLFINANLFQHQNLTDRNCRKTMTWKINMHVPLVPFQFLSCFLCSLFIFFVLMVVARAEHVNWHNSCIKTQFNRFISHADGKIYVEKIVGKRSITS